MRAIRPVPGNVPMWLVFEKLPSNARAMFFGVQRTVYSRLRC
jgi:hypothetical protein